MTVSEARVNLGYTLYPELAAAGLPPAQQLEFANFRFGGILIPCAAWYSFYYLGRLNWGICLPWIIQDLHISRLAAGLCEAALLWGYATATFFAGRASDRFGARILNSRRCGNYHLEHHHRFAKHGDWSGSFHVGQRPRSGSGFGTYYPHECAMVSPSKTRVLQWGFHYVIQHFHRSRMGYHWLYGCELWLANGIHVAPFALCATHHGRPLFSRSRQTTGCWFSSLSGAGRRKRLHSGQVLNR